mmetsp:Transcript_16373/g.41292  ORF Transcript_16373/g.41292 Transcript_16373/m.41292 type:complete len:337 (+) Transcript_16373:442-1452(+)
MHMCQRASVGTKALEGVQPRAIVGRVCLRRNQRDVQFRSWHIRPHPGAERALAAAWRTWRRRRARRRRAAAGLLFQALSQLPQRRRHRNLIQHLLCNSFNLGKASPECIRLDSPRHRQRSWQEPLAIVKEDLAENTICLVFPAIDRVHVERDVLCWPRFDPCPRDLVLKPRWYDEAYVDRALRGLLYAPKHAEELRHPRGVRHVLVIPHDGMLTNQLLQLRVEGAFPSILLVRRGNGSARVTQSGEERRFPATWREPHHGHHRFPAHALLRRGLLLTLCYRSAVLCRPLYHRGSVTARRKRHAFCSPLDHRRGVTVRRERHAAVWRGRSDAEIGQG